MKICNGTIVVSMDPHLYNIVSLTIACLICVGNMLLSIPLLVAICRSPSLLGKPRFLFLFHLLVCDALQLVIPLARAALLTSRLTMPVTQCVVLMSADQFLVMVALLLRAALSLDRCVAIRLPLHYETLLSPVRLRVVVVLVWTLPLLMSVVTMWVMLDRVYMDAAIPLCLLYVVVCGTLWDLGPVIIFYMAVSVLLLSVSFLTILGCFVLLCCQTRGRLCSQRTAGVTLAMQAVQIVIHVMSMVLSTTNLLSSEKNEQWSLATSITYTLGISLISLVYGYRSQELRCRLLKPLVCSQVNTSQ
ncbi:beta-3 adrenergic receptor-like [Alosa sapidissima]|uniref:beta-3 adrenergic receptor-like n=1 Tax=Alosa sapidissima TaxID=34773 RepID=UPI001C0A2A0C|nr:beta-3 adrenergic receptor-like [Alosa sapidissima]